MLQTFTAIALSPLALGIALLGAGLLLGRVLVAVVRPLLGWIALRSKWQWDDLLVQAVATPLGMLLGLQILRLTLPSLELEARSVEIVESTASLFTTGLVIWAAFRCVDVAVSALSNSPWVANQPSTRSLVSISGRFTKVLLGAFSVMAVLAHLGVSVTSLVAGLGIGGLALALSAQKTVENLFGTLSIGVDQPLREGDVVRVADHLGTVEAIGLRSTRIRTPDRTVVTIPNGQLADQRIESLSSRDRMRLACELGLVYGTTAAQLRGVLADVEALLRGHDKLWPEEVVVRFKALGESSLNIEVVAWFQTTEWAEFRDLRQEMLLGFLEIVEKHGTSFAFPTRTVHVAREQVEAPPALAPMAETPRAPATRRKRESGRG
ncbi:MAG: mechanosensitive ion channel family protein [Kofleriaceae bacterium]